ncbi:hypothetical protein PRIPAC_84123, partial [Pristionchus pacificus]|uniref:Uncharacterized protein n=1 Tax=Pristionchus pacificus TaxID=54126 RepID=A0A2A6BVE1_PRIPA
QQHTCHSEVAQAASTLKPPVIALCLDKISVSINCHHRVLRSFPVAIDGQTGIANDVIGERKRLEHGMLTEVGLLSKMTSSIDIFQVFSVLARMLRRVSLISSLVTARQQATQKGWIGGLSEPPSDRLLLPSLDRSWGYGSRRYCIYVERPPSPDCPKGHLYRRSPSCAQWEGQRVVRGPPARLPLHRLGHCPSLRVRLPTIRHVVSGMDGLTSNSASPGIEMRLHTLLHLGLRSAQVCSPSLFVPLLSSIRFITRGPVSILPSPE